MELHASFMRFVIDYETEDRNLAVSPLLKIVYEQFCAKFLSGDSVHAATASMDEATRVELIRTCGDAYRALVRSGAVSPHDRPLHIAPKSALFEAAKDGRASLSAVFGGQGANDVLSELRQLYSTYPETQEYIQKMARAINTCAKSPESQRIGLHTDGMAIVEWLEDESKAPSEAYLLSAPVSFPLIGLTQLANYWLMLQVCACVRVCVACVCARVLVLLVVRLRVLVGTSCMLSASSKGALYSRPHVVHEKPRKIQCRQQVASAQALLYYLRFH